MARIRTIKPEFWIDEKLAPLEPIDRLVFLGLISQADDAGRLVDNARRLNGLLFPETEDCCRDSLETLARLSRITRYTSESGQRLIQITNWDEHQRVDKPSKYTLPPPPPEALEPQGDTEPSGDPPETPARPSRDALAPTVDLRPTTKQPSTTFATRTQAQAAMLAALEEHLPSVEPPMKRRKLEAQARMVLLGEDRKAWEDETGSQIPEDQRPELFRMALGYHADGTQGAFRSSVRYVVKLYCGPDAEDNDPSMSPADRKLVKSINDLRNLDLEASTA